MYMFYRIRDVVRIPPEYLGEPLEVVATRVLRERYEGLVDKDLGVIISVMNVSVEELGVILPGDGATYHRAEFDVIAFKPLLHEVVEGKVVEARDFGIFVNIGPLDGLVHKSQILDDELDFDENRGAYIGRTTLREVGIGDSVRARIIQVSYAGVPYLPRIALTMRQPFLGKLEWIKEDVERIRKGVKARKEKAEEKKAKKPAVSRSRKKR